MSQKYNPSSFKTTIHNLQNTRAHISDGKNLGQNFAKMKQSFDGMQSTLKGQGQYIQNFNSVKDGQSQESKAFQNKRQVQRLLQLAKNQLLQFMDQGENWFSLGKKERKKEQQWQKLRHQLEKQIGVLKSQTNPATAIQTIMKIMNARDFMFKQFLRSLLYRKSVLWLDLNVPMQAYVHGLIKSILNLIKEQQQKHGLIPSFPQYTSITFGQQGRWKMLGQQQKATSLPSLWSLVNQNYEQLCQTIRNYSNLNDDSQALKDINKNGKIVTSLRKKIQQLTNENKELQLRIQQIMATARPDGRGKDDAKQRLQQLQIQLSRKQSQIIQLKSSSINSVTQIQVLKQKIKSLQDQNHHMHMSQLPKLQQMTLIQNNLNQLFIKIKKDVDTYATLFSIQSQSKKKLLKQLQHSQQTVQGLVKMLQKSKIKNKQLLLDIQKTDKKCLQIVAARQIIVNKLKLYDPTFKDVGQ